MNSNFDNPNLSLSLPVDILLCVFALMFGFSLRPIFVFSFIFFDKESINFTSLNDSQFIKKIFFEIAYRNSSIVFPTPEKTILFGLIFDFNASFNSPIDTTSAPIPNLAYSLIIFWFEFDFKEKQINNELTPVYTDKSVTSKEALEIHWKLSIRELSRARNHMESTVNETSHIRHLNTEDLEDYSEISGEIITDSFFLKLNFSKLKKLLETAKDVGSFSILHSDGEKSFMSLYDYLNQNPDRGNLDLDVRLLLYIN